jgi:hypothetical protein
MNVFNYVMTDSMEIYFLIHAKTVMLLVALVMELQIIIVFLVDQVISCIMDNV